MRSKLGRSSWGGRAKSLDVLRRLAVGDSLLTDIVSNECRLSRSRDLKLPKRQMICPPCGQYHAKPRQARCWADSANPKMDFKWSNFYFGHVRLLHYSDTIDSRKGRDKVLYSWDFFFNLPIFRTS